MRWTPTVRVRFRKDRGKWLVDVRWPDGFRKKYQRDSEGEADKDAILAKASFLNETWPALRDSWKDGGAAGRLAECKDDFFAVIDEYAGWHRANFPKGDQQYGSLLEQIKAHFIGEKFALVTVRDVDRMVVEMQKAGFAPGTINHRIKALRSLFRWAKERKMIGADIMESYKYLPVPEWIGPPISADMAVAVLRKLKEHPAYFPLRALFETGLRKRLIRLLRWDQVDEENSLLIFEGESNKPGKALIVPVKPAVMEAIHGQPRHPGVPYVWYNPETLRPWDDWKKAWKNACKAAGVTGLRMHDLRAVLCIHLIEEGATDKQIMALQGWNDQRMVSHYGNRYRAVLCARDALRLVKREQAI